MLTTLLSFATAFLPSQLRIALLRRFNGAVIGAGAHLAIGAVVQAESIEIGPGARIGPLTYVRARRLVMGPRSSIGGLCRVTAHDFELGPQARLSQMVEVNGDVRDPHARFRAGMASWVFQRCFIDLNRPVELGRNVGVGGSSFLFTHGVWLSAAHGFPTSRAAVTIGDDTWLPWRCFVMPGVKIGSRVIVGAQSVVNRDLQDDVVAAGAPAKVVRTPSAALLSYRERRAILAELLAEFAERGDNGSLSEDDQGRVLLTVDRMPVAVLNTESCSIADTTSLNIIWSPRPPAEYRRARLYCVEDFHCSPWLELSDRQRQLLDSFRSKGLRAYPVDEVEWAPRDRLAAAGE